MQDTENILVHLTCKSQNKSIHTTLTDEIREILSSAGFKWYQAPKGPVDLSAHSFAKVEKLITPDPG